MLLSSTAPPEFPDGCNRKTVNKNYSRALLNSSWKTQCPPYLVRTDNKTFPRTAVFFNSIGGLGDSIPIVLAMQLYKKYHPMDKVILYDSMFLWHYFKKLDFVDFVVPAGDHLYSNYAVEMILNMDPELRSKQCYPISILGQMGATDFVSTHHAHNIVFPSDNGVVHMDIHTYLADAVLHGCVPFNLDLKSPFQARVDQLLNAINPDGRLLFGLQNRAQNPYKTHQLEGADYLERLEQLASQLVERFNARVLLCGDIPLRSPVHYSSGSWVDLNSIERNVYIKIKLLSQCDFFLGASSGMSIISNLMRTPNQAPGLLIYASMDAIELTGMTKLYPHHVANGGGMNANRVIWTYQHPDLADFIFDPSHDNDKILTLLDKFVHEQKEQRQSRWLIKH